MDRRFAAVEQNPTTSPSQPSCVESAGHGGATPPRPTPPPRSSKTVLTTVPSKNSRYSRHQKDDDQRKLTSANAHTPDAKSRSVRRQGYPTPHPALPNSNARAYASRTATKEAEAPSTFYMTRASYAVPQSAKRWNKSLIYSGDAAVAKPESTAAQNSSPSLMIIDSRGDRYEEIADEFAIPPAPQRLAPPKGQKETQKQESSVVSVKTNIQSSSTTSQNAADDSPPVPKPRLKKKSASLPRNSQRTANLTTTATTTATTSDRKRLKHPNAKLVPVLSRTVKEKPVRPPPPVPTRERRPPLPVPTETKTSPPQQFLSVSCPVGTSADVFGQPSISPEPTDDPEYAYVVVRNTVVFSPKHDQVNEDSDSDKEGKCC